MNFYIGSGIKYFFFYTYTNSDYAKKYVYANGMAGVIETGFTTTAVKHVVFDIFDSYSLRTFGASSISPSKYPAVIPT